MSLRKVEIIVDKESREALEELIQQNNIERKWWYHLSEKSIKLEFIIEAEASEEVLDKLDKRFSSRENTRIIISQIEAVLPRPKEEKKEALQKEVKPEKASPLLRISRTELIDDIRDFGELSTNFIMMMIFSSVVAGIGILKDNIAIIIGAMVIAPMLGPNISLAFGTVLGDITLVKKSIRTSFVAIVIAVVISFIWGIINPGDVDDIARTEIRLSDLAIALMSGAAGAVALLRSASASLVGVMVAVALLPPLIKSGLLAGEGYWQYSLYAFLIFIANTICVNLAGIITFFVSKIRPKYWWEEKKAKKYTYNALKIWFTLLVLLIVIILFLNVE
ncbi:MAG: TIGR00341 family protein [Bacteroidales bacterium]|nr:TIGR00341 family protein [Bacteroidales bacterium]MCF8343011.1 TIGR00341 family protein [Bacteroidales bacterium]MCF8350313.1 TIGR00341 family protein [Bacteroidales bacterium]MCF8375983.1 TIGR00341 family protein [Bacteroidales bacterium]MCF8400471.1 TIGR00341 family protein [Bacteroidales bacterium]